jgi:hypothetical protein
MFRNQTFQFMAQIETIIRIGESAEIRWWLWQPLATDDPDLEGLPDYDAPIDISNSNFQVVLSTPDKTLKITAVKSTFNYDFQGTIGVKTVSQVACEFTPEQTLSFAGKKIGLICYEESKTGWTIPKSDGHQRIIFKQQGEF